MGQVAPEAALPPVLPQLELTDVGQVTPEAALLPVLPQLVLTAGEQL